MHGMCGHHARLDGGDKESPMTCMNPIKSAWVRGGTVFYVLHISYPLHWGHLDLPKMQQTTVCEQINIASEYRKPGLCSEREREREIKELQYF